MQPQELHSLFRHNLRHLRSEIGMSQSELARRTGLPASHICNLEGGKLNPSLGTLAKIAEALDTTPSNLLSRVFSDAGTESLIST